MSTSKKWRKVEGPKVWRPKLGDELEGFYGGTRTFEGSYGKYEVVIIYTETGAFSISGCKALSLVRCAGALDREDKVRFVYKGTVDVGHDNVMKDYELYVLR